MDIKLSGLSQKVFVVVIAFFLAGGLLYFYYFKPNLESIKPLQTETKSIKATLATTSESLYNTDAINEQISAQKAKYEKLLSESGKLPQPVTITDKEILLLVGALTKQLGVDVSNYRNVSTQGDSIVTEMTFIGHYEDLALLFKAFERSEIAYTVNNLELKQVAINGVQNQSSSIVYPWASQGTATEVTSDLPLFIPSAMGLTPSSLLEVAKTKLPEVPVIKRTSEPDKLLDVEADMLVEAVEGESLESPPAPTTPPAVSPIPEPEDSSSVGETYLTVDVKDLRVQLKTRISIRKTTINLDLTDKEKQSGHTNPWGYFLTDNFKNYLDRNNYDYGSGGTPTNDEIQRNIEKLQSDNKYLDSELVRTRSVIANRQSIGIGVETQMEYLYLLLFLDFEGR